MPDPSALRLQLLDKVTANTTGQPFKWTGVGSGTLHTYGTFDTSSTTIEISTDGCKTWTTAVTAITAANVAAFLHGMVHVRAVIASVGGSTEVSCDLVPPERP